MKKNGFDINKYDPIKCIYWIIGINVAVHFLIQNQSRFALYTIPTENFQIHQFVTYMFFHSKADFFHILFNMWGVYLFGKFTAPVLGSKRFLQLYAFSGVFAGVFWFLANFNVDSAVVGASGALFGLLIATALIAPNQRIMLLFPPIPMKLKTFAIVFGLLEVFYTLSNAQQGVANLAHLGGIIGGYICMRYIFKLPVWDVFGYFFGKKKQQAKPFKAPKGWSMGKDAASKPTPSTTAGYKQNNDIKDANSHFSQKELDRILDKISSQGMQSLTAEETAMLRSARDQMRK